MERSVDIHVRLPEQSVQKLDELGQYLHRRGYVNDPNRTEVIKYALDVLLTVSKQAIIQEREGRKVGLL